MGTIHEKVIRMAHFSIGKHLIRCPSSNTLQPPLLQEVRGTKELDSHSTTPCPFPQPPAPTCLPQTHLLLVSILWILSTGQCPPKVLQTNWYSHPLESWQPRQWLAVTVKGRIARHMMSTGKRIVRTGGKRKGVQLWPQWVCSLPSHFAVQPSPFCSLARSLMHVG